MTIRCFKLYLEYHDKAVARAMNRTHFGVMYWVESRLKEIRERLDGAEVRGADIVNIFFCEDGWSAGPFDIWRRNLNGIEYRLKFDVQSMIDRDPISNLRDLIPIAARLCQSAPWSQIVAIGEVLEKPMTAS